MNLGDYELVRQISADAVCVRYAARRAGEGALVELRIMNQNADNGVLWDRYYKRLKITRLIEHAAIVRIIELAEHNEPPYLVVDPVAIRSLREAAGSDLPLTIAEAVPLAAQLTDAIAAAHRFGVAHGKLTADQVGLSQHSVLHIDLTDVVPTVKSVRTASAAFADDVLACGRLIFWLLGMDSTIRDRPTDVAGNTSTNLQTFIESMVDSDASRRPAMFEVAARFQNEAACLFNATAAAPPRTEDPRHSATLIDPYQPADAKAKVMRIVTVGEQLGRFRLLEELGHGGMGSVFRARDEADDSIVAIKVIRPDAFRLKDTLARFRREAQLLADVNNPYVTNLIEVNEDDGVPFLAMEFVAGRTLQQKLDAQKKLDEATAVSIMSDVCRALSDAHRRGIVHRDIKPDNILLAEVTGNATVDGTVSRVKLTDFGIARCLTDDHSGQLTQTGNAIGTPLYMSPEQCEDGKSADARSDVYSVGATLFHLLAGRPPFLASSFAKLIRLHCEQPPPYLKTIDAALSDAISEIVDRSLSKHRDQRFENADDLLRAFDGLLHGASSAATSHPVCPTDDQGRVLTYSWSWNLNSSPHQLWPHVSNTDRFNRAVGLPAVRFRDARDNKGRMQRFGQFLKLGVLMQWREHPFEWVEGRRHGVLREYTRGPFHWMRSFVDMIPAGQGTRLSHTVQICPTGLFGQMLAAFEIGIKARRAFGSVYQRIDTSIGDAASHSTSRAAFEPSQSLSRRQWQRLESRLQQLRDAGISAATVDGFGDFLGEAPAQEVARIRPLVLAQQMKLDEDELLVACLHAANIGLLTLSWDVLCPVCRISSEMHSSLQAVRDHAFCPACDLKYDVDPSNAIELVFRVHDSIRSVDVQTYCVGGPAHLPHVVAQLKLRAGERLNLHVTLPPGTYAVHQIGQAAAQRIRVFFGASSGRSELPRSQIGRTPAIEMPPGEQELTLHNDLTDEFTIRLERTALRSEAIVATQLFSMPLFHQLFPAEVLSSESLYGVSNAAVAAVAELPPEQLRHVERIFTEHGGTICAMPENTTRPGFLAVFNEAVTAVRASVAAMQTAASDRMPSVAIHAGPVHVTGGSRALTYSGESLMLAGELSELVGQGNPLVSQAVTSDEEVAAFARSAGIEFVVSKEALSSRPDLLLCRIALTKSQTDQ